MKFAGLALGLLTLSASAGSGSDGLLHRQFAECLEKAMMNYPSVDPLADYRRSMHLPPDAFGIFLGACMRAHGFREQPSGNAGCLDPTSIGNEALWLRAGEPMMLWPSKAR